MSARDDLAEITDLLDPRHCARRSGGSLMLSVREVATRMAAAGWRPPERVIDTVEELEALADETVIRDQAGDVFEALPDAGGMLFWLGDEAFPPSSVRLPATVLWEPEAGNE